MNLNKNQIMNLFAWRLPTPHATTSAFGQVSEWLLHAISRVPFALQSNILASVRLWLGRLASRLVGCSMGRHTAAAHNRITEFNFICYFISRISSGGGFFDCGCRFFRSSRRCSVFFFFFCCALPFWLFCVKFALMFRSYGRMVWQASLR